MYVDVHSALTLHHLRSEELHADAERVRLARAVARHGGRRWWPRGARRHGGAATRAPAMP
ncbi:hypothetical protein [Phytohabitans rumicis]|uniref:Uncharacterized protein n=1 Tax=Phytohabitans rumicis TaxID=1076125 RepID=A0A6V8LID3_9ACTN|nr:hypothetical protein [Phytohabitans rumicis]GFJ92405.1 hypothetical protein Prum_060470 [Phytohabitans rumicis]